MKQIRVFSVATALLFVATAAQAQHGKDEQHGHQDQRGSQRVEPQRVEQQRVQQRVEPQRVEPQRVEPQRVEPQRVEPQRVQQRVEQQRVDPRIEQQRVDRERIDQGRVEQQRGEQQRIDQLRDRQRDEQFDRQRDLQLQRQREQEQLERERVIVDRRYEGDRDDRRLNVYRYNYGGVYRETNGYGADVLRQAVDRGYQEGYRAGLTDRRDRVSPNFQRALEFGQGGFGYTGPYVPSGDYQYYFREGFQRGYDDAYGNRARYGTYYNGNPSILGDIAAGILGLTMIR